MKTAELPPTFCPECQRKAQDWIAGRGLKPAFPPLWKTWLAWTGWSVFGFFCALGSAALNGGRL